MIHHYHAGRESSNPTRRGANFWYVSNGNLKHADASHAGTRLYLGVELEVDSFRNGSVAFDASEYVDSKLGEFAQCVHDGSLCDGFEIVFDPMTLAAFEKIRPIITEVMDELNRRGGHSHDSDNCGLHVHVSRAACGNDDDAKALAYGKIMELTARFELEFSRFARRDLRCTNWCRPTLYTADVTDGSRAVRRKAKAFLDWQGYDCHTDRRYRVWNFQNRNTIECRAFRGTLKSSTFYATLGFVDGLVRFCTLKTTPEVHAATFDSMLAWINNSDAVNYWVERRHRSIGTAA